MIIVYRRCSADLLITTTNNVKFKETRRSARRKRDETKKKKNILFPLQKSVKGGTPYGIPQYIIWSLSIIVLSFTTSYGAVATFDPSSRTFTVQDQPLAARNMPNTGCRWCSKFWHFLPAFKSCFPSADRLMFVKSYIVAHIRCGVGWIKWNALRQLKNECCSFYQTSVKYPRIPISCCQWVEDLTVWHCCIFCPALV